MMANTPPTFNSTQRTFCLLMTLYLAESGRDVLCALYHTRPTFYLSASSLPGHLSKSLCTSIMKYIVLKIQKNNLSESVGTESARSTIESGPSMKYHQVAQKRRKVGGVLLKVGRV